MSEHINKPAPPLEKRGCDTEDLLLIHAVFRSGFSRAEGLISKTDPADSARVKFVSDHLDELLQTLHNHHHHEDVLWWDRLREREPGSAADVERMINAHNEIARLIEAVQEARAAWVKTPGDKAEFLQRLRRLQDALFAHLSDEEKHIMPLAARVLTQKEWDEAHTIGQDEIPRNRLLFQLGYILQCAPTPALRQKMLDGIPGFVRLLYRLFGKKKFEAEWISLYGSLD